MTPIDGNASIAQWFCGVLPPLFVVVGGVTLFIWFFLLFVGAERERGTLDHLKRLNYI